MPDFFKQEPGGEQAQRILAEAMKSLGLEPDAKKDLGVKEIQEVEGGEVVEERIRVTEDNLAEDDPDLVTAEEETVEYEDDRHRTDVEPAPRMPTTINLFQHPDAHPFVLDLALLRRYGPEWLQWEPETLEDVILRDFKTKTLSDVNLEKLQGIRTLHMQDTFWQEWQIFMPTALALNGVPADFEVMQFVTVPQAMIAVDIANRIREDVKWSVEMETFLSVLHLHEGFFVPQEPLAWVEVDDEEYDVDAKDVRERWQHVRATRKAPPATSPENEQLRRMLGAWELLQENRQQLDEQLPLIYHA